MTTQNNGQKNSSFTRGGKSPLWMPTCLRQIRIACSSRAEISRGNENDYRFLFFIFFEDKKAERRGNDEVVRKHMGEEQQNLGSKKFHLYFYFFPIFSHLLSRFPNKRKIKKLKTRMYFLWFLFIFLFRITLSYPPPYPPFSSKVPYKTSW